MNAFGLSGLLIGITSTAMAILVFFKNRRSLANKLWIAFTICAAIWGFGGLKISTVKDLESAFFYWRLTHVGIICIPVFYIHFIYEFLKRKERWPIYLAYISGIFFLSISFSDLFIRNVEWSFDSFYYDGRPPTLLYSAFTVWLNVILAISQVILFTALKKSDGIRKTQIKYFLWGMLVSFSGGVTSFLPVFGLNVYPYGNLLGCIYPLVITYAILRHRLMDIHVVFSRSLVAVLLGAGVIGFDILFVKLLHPVIGYYFSGAIAMLIIGGVLFATPLSRKLQLGMDQMVLGGKYNYQNIFREASRTVLTILNMNDLVSYMVNMLRQSLGWPYSVGAR